MSLSNEEFEQMMADDVDDDEKPRQWGIRKHGPRGCRLVEWPFCQKYMDEEWFDEEAYLDITDKHGDCAYWIPENRLAL